MTDNMIGRLAAPRPTWRTASFSSNGSNCVEVLEADGETFVRDTKDRDGGVLALSAAQWTAFLDEVAEGRPSANGAVEVREDGDGARDVTELASGTVLHFTPGEWQAFRSGVLAGEFDRTAA